MAVLKLSWFIVSISGRLGNIVFYMRRGTQCCRVYIKPANPDTQAQKENRGRFAIAVMSWQGLPEPEKKNYAEKARNLNMSGYNLYISEFMNTQNSTETNLEMKQLSADSLSSAGRYLRTSFASASLPLRFIAVSYSLMPLTLPLQTADRRQFMRKG